MNNKFEAITEYQYDMVSRKVSALMDVLSSTNPNGDVINALVGGLTPTLESIKTQIDSIVKAKIIVNGGDVGNFVYIKVLPRLESGNLQEMIHRSKSLWMGLEYSRAKIERAVELDGDFYERYTADLNWTAPFLGRGGKYVPDEKLSTTDQHMFAEEDYAAIREHGYRLLTKVINKDTGEFFFTDCQGYDYARYVAVIDEYKEGVK